MNFSLNRLKNISGWTVRLDFESGLNLAYNFIIILIIVSCSLLCISYILFETQILFNQQTSIWALFLFVCTLGLLISTIVRHKMKSAQRKANRNMVCCLHSSQEDFFLIKKIGDEYIIMDCNIDKRKSLPGVSDCYGRSFGEFLQQQASPRIYLSSLTFLTLMYDKKRKERGLYHLNPLQAVKISQNKDSTKYIKFHFSRIMHKSKIEALLVAVSDVTKEAVLSHRLKEYERGSLSQMENLYQVMQVNPNHISEFMRNLTNEINAISALVSEKNSTTINQEKLQKLYRLLSELKKDANKLNLVQFSENIHKNEEILAQLMEMEDAISPIVLQEINGQIRATFNHMRSTVNRLQDFQEALLVNTTNHN